MRRILITAMTVAALCLVLLMAVGPIRCRTSLAAPEPDVITCSDSGPLVKRVFDKLDELFEEGTGIKVKYRRSKQEVVEQVLDGKVDWGCIMRPLTDVEKLKKLKEYQIGWDAYAVIVHPDNPCTGLSLEELCGVLTGEVRSWTGLGGLERNIIVYSPSRGGGAYDALDETVLHGKDPYKRAKPIGSDDLMIKTVSRSIAGIGIISAAAVPEDDEDVKVISVEGVIPTVWNVAAKKYPIALPIMCVTGDKPSNSVKEFLRFCVSPTGQECLSAYYMPVKFPDSK